MKEQIQLIADEKDIRLDAWLAARLEDCSRTYVQKLIEEGRVLVNGKPVKTNYRLTPGEEISVSIPAPEVLTVEPEKMDLDVVFEDAHIIVINKPKGLVVHPAAGNYTGTLVNGLMDYCGDRLSDINGVIRPGIVHRIDKDTSGLLVVAKSNVAHERLCEKLKTHDIQRTYVALAEGVLREERGRIDAPIGRHPVDRKKMAVNLKNGKHAVTHFEVLERFANATYLELQLETGRTHQIRVHLSYIGHPIIGDEVYGKSKQRFDIGGQALHARQLKFLHPVTGEEMVFHAPLPQYFQELLQTLRK